MNFFVAKSNSGVEEAINLDNVAMITKKERSADGYRLTFTFVGGNSVSLLYEDKQSRDKDFSTLIKSAKRIKEDVK